MTSPTCRRAPGSGSRCGVTRTARHRVHLGAGQEVAALRLTNSRFTSSAIGSSTTTEFSDEQSTPLSNVLPVMMSRTAFVTSADPLDVARARCRDRRRRPACPALYAARTSPMPPVARITATSRCFISSCVPSSVTVVIQLIAPVGRAGAARGLVHDLRDAA